MHELPENLILLDASKKVSCKKLEGYKVSAINSQDISKQS